MQNPNLNFKVQFSAFSFLLSVFVPGIADAITVEDVNSLSGTARQAADTFMQESFRLRVEYEYNGRFYSQNDEENLRKIAQKAFEQLQDVADKQKKLKKQIEDYQGDDWEARYGSTGLWRGLFSDLYITNLYRCDIEFYLALTAAKPEKNKTLQEVLHRLDLLSKAHSSAGLQFLRARIFSELAQTEQTYRQPAAQELNSLATEANVPCSIRFSAIAAKIKLEGLAEPNQPGTLIEELLRSNCCDDVETVLRLAFALRKYDGTIFEKIVRSQPQIKGLLGMLILSSLSGTTAEQPAKQALERISVFEAELAAEAAWRDGPQTYKTLLEGLSDAEKFQTPLILYVTAAAFEKTSQAKTVKLLIKASRLQQIKKEGDSRLDIEAGEIAKEAAQIGYNLFTKDSRNCRTAIEAFENYGAIAGEKTDEELEYLNSVVLNNCGQTEKGRQLLKKIADRPAGQRRNKARLNLIIYAIQQKDYEKQKNDLIRQLRSLIADCDEKNQNDVKTEAAAVYCRLLLESGNQADAQKVLDVLTEKELSDKPELNILKSTALLRLEKTEEAVKSIFTIDEPNRCEYCDQTTKLLAEIIDKMDQLQEQMNEPDFTKTSQKLEKLAEFSNDCLKTRQTGLYLAEVSSFVEKDGERLSAIEKTLDDTAQNDDANDTNVLRCRARLLAAQGKFDKSAELWARICQTLKNETPSGNTRSWRWWQAKFYELDCRAKMSPAKKDDIRHVVEVLENSFQDIPPLWAKKLNSLKQQ